MFDNDKDAITENDGHQNEDDMTAEGQQEASPQAEAAENEPRAAEAFLDALTDDSEGTSGDDHGSGQDDAQHAEGAQPRDEHGRFKAKEDGSDGAADQDPETQEVKKKDREVDHVDVGSEEDKHAKEDEELLAGIKSDRGRERVQKLIEERNETKARAMELDQAMNEVRQVLDSAGMDARQFAQHIEFSRLINSNDPQSLGLAAQMIEEVRADIYKRLGRDAPGVDVLSDFPDLAQRVDNFEMTRDAALEIAQYRRHQQELQRQQQDERMLSQQVEQGQQELQNAMHQLEAYLQQRSGEADHNHRMEALGKYFKDPQNIQEFVRTYQPSQIAQAIRFMYDNVQVAPRQPNPAPLRSRPAPLGKPETTPDMDPSDRLMHHLDRMGI